MDELLLALGGKEREVLMWLSRGYDVDGIAGMMCYSSASVYEWLRAVRELLGVRTNAGAVVEGLRLWVIGMPGQEEMAK